MPMSFLDVLMLLVLAGGVGLHVFIDRVERKAPPVLATRPRARARRAPVATDAVRKPPTGAATVAARAMPPTGVRMAPRVAHPPTPVLPRMADLLVVDDSTVARTKLRRLFESAGYTVQVACDGVEALALLEKGRYGVMLTDLEMPRMDGVALIGQCRARTHLSRMPILAISGHESLRAKFDECQDVAGIHPKPWADDVLLGHVGTFVQVGRATRQAALAT